MGWRNGKATKSPQTLTSGTNEPWREIRGRDADVWDAHVCLCPKCGRAMVGVEAFLSFGNVMRVHWRCETCETAKDRPRNGN